jgi:hypothetical protein
MAQGSGYVFLWNVGDVGGFIHVCGGDHLVGEDVAFAFAGCNKQVKDILRQADITEEVVDCPPPGGALRVNFDFDIVEGEDLAVNVRL